MFLRSMFALFAAAAVDGDGKKRIRKISVWI